LSWDGAHLLEEASPDIEELMIIRKILAEYEGQQENR